MPPSNAVSEELVELVQSVYTRSTSARSLGAPVKLGRVWLDILVPYGPPPEFEQSGYVRPHVGRRQKRKRKVGFGVRADVQVVWRSLITTSRGLPDQSLLYR